MQRCTRNHGLAANLSAKPQIAGTASHETVGAYFWDRHCSAERQNERNPQATLADDSLQGPMPLVNDHPVPTAAKALNAQHASVHRHMAHDLNDVEC